MSYEEFNERAASLGLHAISKDLSKLHEPLILGPDYPPGSFFKDPVADLGPARCQIAVNFYDFFSVTRSTSVKEHWVNAHLLMEAMLMTDPDPMTEFLKRGTEEIINRLQGVKVHPLATDLSALDAALADYDAVRVTLPEGAVHTLMQAGLISLKKSEFFIEPELIAGSPLIKHSRGFVRSGLRQVPFFIAGASQMLDMSSMLDTPVSIGFAPPLPLDERPVKREHPLDCLSAYVTMRDGTQTVVPLRSLHGYSDEFFEIYGSRVSDGEEMEAAHQTALALMS